MKTLLFLLLNLCPPVTPSTASIPQGAGDCCADCPCDPGPWCPPDCCRR